jgi:2-iminobutanoate/2-iminopropanoate deaminase
MEIERINASGAPSAGAYSHAVVHGDVIYTCGQLPLDPANGELVAGGAGEQTSRVLDNLEIVLRAAGSDLSRVLQATVYLVDRHDWPAMNAVFAERFAGTLPGRTAVEVGPLALGARVEIDVVAAR